MADRTLVIIKPDAVERGLAGEILARLERKGLRLVALELRQLEEAVLARHYEEHQGKPFYGDLVEFMGRSPAVVAVVEGPEDTWKVVRTLMGPTNPRDAAPGTIRGDLGTILTENLVHGSDGPESAAREIAIFFSNLNG
jgi:nucleoside-diphosphate kinase